MSHVVKIDEDGVIDLPQEIIDALGLKEGDRLSWKPREDGSVALEKVKTKLVLVETIATFRHRYVVELREDDPAEYACDTVTMEDALETAQEYLGETIVSHRVITEDEFLNDIVEDYCKSWSKELIYKNLVTPLED